MEGQLPILESRLHPETLFKEELKKLSPDISVRKKILCKVAGKKKSSLPTQSFCSSNLRTAVSVKKRKSRPADPAFSPQNPRTN